MTIYKPKTHWGALFFQTVNMYVFKNYILF